MAIYTVELGELIESKFDLGMKTYPCYNEEIRERLNKKIMEHFYFREIGLETPELFKRFLNRKMFEIMPYYNQLYKSEDLEYNPLFNIDLTETFERERKLKTDGKNTTNSSNNTKVESENNRNNTQNNSGENVSVDADNPKSMITMEDVKNNKYATSTNYSTGEHKNIENEVNKGKENRSDLATLNGEVVSNNDELEKFTRKTEGSSAGLSFSRAIQQWRDVMLNIDLMIIDELEPLFMGIY